MNISPDTFITDVLKTVDVVIGNFVQTGFTNLVHNNLTVINLAMTLYVIWLGYRFITHTLVIDTGTVRHVIAIISVYALLTQWNLFYLFFYNIFTNEPGVITRTMVESDPSAGFPGKDTYEALNAVYKQGMDAALALFRSGGFTSMDGLRMYFFGLLVMGITWACCLIALAFIVYAKMAMAIMLFIAPIFLMLMLWPSTREFFNKWMQALFNYAFIPIIVCGILMLTLSVINYTLPGLQQTVASTTPTLKGLTPFLGFTLVSALLYTQVLPTASALSGGLSLENIAAAIPIAKRAFSASGAPLAGKAVNAGYQRIRERFTGKREESKKAKSEQVSKGNG